MINPFFNEEEHRMRAFFRVLLFIFVFVMLTGASSAIPWVWLDYLMRSALILGAFYVMFRYGDRRPWSLSGLHPDKIWIRECVAGVVIAGGVMALIFITEWLSGGLEITGFAWEHNRADHWLIPLGIFLVQMASVGFYEEVMARGYLLPNITEGFTIKKISPQKAAMIAVVLSSAIFGIAHGSNPNSTPMAVVNIMLAGAMLAVPFLITGRLSLPIGLHFSWNFFQGGIFGFRVSGLEIRGGLIEIRQLGPEWWTGGSFGPEAGLIGILGILAILAISLIYLKNTGVSLQMAPLFSKEFPQLKRPSSEKIEA